MFKVQAIIEMIRAFFRRKPTAQKPKSYVTVPDEIELEEVLSGLKLLNEEPRPPHPSEALPGAPSTPLNPPSSTAPNSPHSLLNPAAIVPTSLDTLDIYTQFLSQNPTRVDPRRHQKLRHLDKVFFISACIYLVGAISWIAKRELPLSIASNRTIVQAETDWGAEEKEDLPTTELSLPPAESAQTSQLETESLKVIQSAAHHNHLPVPPVRQLPQLEVASAPAPVLAPPPPKPVSLPTATPPKAPAPKLTQAPSPIPSPPAPKASDPTATNSSPVLPSPPTEAPSASTVQSPPVLSSEAVSSPINSRLVGILQLGDRSVALFDLNDVTQRVKVGDRIGSSGWILGALTDQTAEIFRDQEKRSLYVGEGF